MLPKCSKGAFKSFAFGGEENVSIPNLIKQGLDGANMKMQICFARRWPLLTLLPGLAILVGGLKLNASAGSSAEGLSKNNLLTPSRDMTYDEGLDSKNPCWMPPCNHPKSELSFISRVKIHERSIWICLLTFPCSLITRILATPHIITQLQVSVLFCERACQLLNQSHAALHMLYWRDTNLGGPARSLFLHAVLLNYPQNWTKFKTGIDWYECACVYIYMYL